MKLDRRYVSQVYPNLIWDFVRDHQGGYSVYMSYLGVSSCAPVSSSPPVAPVLSVSPSVAISAPPPPISGPPITAFPVSVPILPHVPPIQVFRRDIPVTLRTVSSSPWVPLIASALPQPTYLSIRSLRLQFRIMSLRFLTIRCPQGRSVFSPVSSGFSRPFGTYSGFSTVCTACPVCSGHSGPSGPGSVTSVS